MNPKHISVRMDQMTGELWLTEEKFAQRPKRIKMITKDVILALAAEIVAVDDTRSASREVHFSDGAIIRITVEEIRKEEQTDGTTIGRDGTERDEAEERSGSNPDADPGQPPVPRSDNAAGGAPE